MPSKPVAAQKQCEGVVDFLAANVDKANVKEANIVGDNIVDKSSVDGVEDSSDYMKVLSG